MQRYLNNPKELADNAAENLGPMDKGTYASYFAKAQEVAEKYGIKRILLGVDFKYKPGGHTFLDEYAYPVSASEWAGFVASADKTLEHMPNVYLVDGDKFCLPI